MNEDPFTEDRQPRPRDFVPPQTSSGHEDDSAIGVEVTNWRTVHPNDIEGVWLELDDWVSWLIHRYQLPPEKIGDCWWRHGAAVEELSALRTCWSASFHESDSGYGPIGFHERLDAALPRLVRTFEPCLRGEHYENPRPRTPSRDEQTWHHWISSSHAHFPGTTGEEKEE